jgi:hypothetical protein
MIRLIRRFFLAALLLLPFSPLPLPQHEAKAAATVLCAPNPVEGASARTIGGTLSPVPSGTIYTLNGQGCAVIAQADVGYFQSIGFTAGPPFGPNILFTTGVWTGTTSMLAGTLPPSTYIQHFIFSNSTANAVTGGIAIGTTSGANDIVTAQTCGANCLVYPLDSSLSKRIFSPTVPQQIWITPVTAGNNANVTVSIISGYF